MFRAAPLLFFGVCLGALAVDLVKRRRLAEVGGRYVVELLGTLLVMYGVDRGAVRSAVAGSAVLAVSSPRRAWQRAHAGATTRWSTPRHPSLSVRY